MCSRFFKLLNTDARDRNSKVFGKIQVSMALFLSSKIHQGDDLKVFNLEANIVLL
jgi:hypothetical protein